MTIYVSDVDQAVDFYVSKLGFKLNYRGGPGFASIDAGKGLILGLHKPHPGSPAAGTRGSMSVGFNVTEPIETVVARLTEQGVKFPHGVHDDGPVKLAPFGDPDGNALHLVQTSHGQS